ncbi:MAG: M15 family metallopeptidase [Actinomycetota bacterium]|nr:M15 family metallopeptidase [Actinomycetota bacterium]
MPTSPGPEPSYSTWELGAHPLPLRPDGFGVVRPTPPTLRDRRYPTVDLLPPPAGEEFASTIGRITPALRQRMGTSWSPQCPVGLDGLRYLTVSFRGFDGAAHTGELVVAAAAAEDVVSVFRALYAADFPIEEMRLPGTADLEAPPTGDGNDTVGLVCRPSIGQTQWSAHAYGLAIDLNPFMNPYLRGDLVLPELAGSYLDRSWHRPGMIFGDDLVVRAFARIGWSWGGDWTSLKDYQHFTALDR